MKSPRSGWHRAEAGYFTLIGLLAAIVIIGILFVLFFNGGGGGSSATGTGARTTPGKAKEMAQDVLCENNLRQLRYELSIYQSSAGTNPPSLASLETQVVLECPIGGEPYEYDPLSGQVHCVHPGHGGY